MQTTTLRKSSLWQCINQVQSANSALSDSVDKPSIKRTFETSGDPVLGVRLIMNPLNLHGKHFLLLLSCIGGSLHNIQIRHLLVAKYREVKRATHQEAAHLYWHIVILYDLLTTLPIFQSSTNIQNTEPSWLRWLAHSALCSTCDPGFESH